MTAELVKYALPSLALGRCRKNDRGCRVDVMSYVLGGFAALLAVTLFPAAAERGILGAVGFLVAVGLAWPRTKGEYRPAMVVGVLIAGIIGAFAMPLVMNATIPRLFLGDFIGAAISMIAPVVVWAIASAVRMETSSQR